MAVPDLNWIGGDISFDKPHDSEHFGHFRFPIPVAKLIYFFINKSAKRTLLWLRPGKYVILIDVVWAGL